MFISNPERIQLRKDIDAMSKIIGDMSAEVLYLGAKIKALEGKTPEAKKPRKKHTMSPETKARMSQMMKDRHAKEKLEKANATSISTTSI